ncbi:MAG: hypothetical protein ACLP5H_24090 [Desulfomonilaceae bacterium]
MQEISVPLDKFDLDGFINKTISFIEAQISKEIDPSAAIVWVEAPGRGPHDESDQGWHFKAKLMGGEAFLLFPFALPGDSTEPHCADGKSYNISTDSSDDDEYEEGGYVDTFFDATVGYLVRVDNGTISLSSAICPIAGGCGPPARVNLYPDCGVLEQPMTEFVWGFLRR